MEEKKEKKGGWLSFGIGLVASLAVGWFLFPNGIHSTKFQPVAFSHQKHGEGASLSCQDCHFFRTDGSFAGIPPLSKCMECHESPVSGSKEEEAFLTLATELKKKREEIPWLIYSKQPDNVFFSHAAHIQGARLDCKECHRSVGGQTDRNPPYRYKWISGYAPEVMSMKTCESCHARKGTSNACFVCHK